MNVDECLKEMELPEENGIANCLKSTDEFFVVLCEYITFTIDYGVYRIHDKCHQDLAFRF